MTENEEEIHACTGNWSEMSVCVLELWEQLFWNFGSI